MVYSTTMDTFEDLLQVDRLIRLLKEMEEDKDKEMEEDSDRDRDREREIVALATDYLTVGPYVMNYRERVRAAGFPVYPGEVDGFGWLTAYFQMKRGVLVFG